MSDNSSPNQQEKQYSVEFEDKPRTVKSDQERICDFFLKTLKEWTAEEILQEFRNLFVDCLLEAQTDNIGGVYTVFFEDKEQEFQATIKRCSYIIVNTWITEKKYKYIDELVDLFEEYKRKRNLSFLKKTTICQSWLDNFIKSKNYKELKIFSSKYKETEVTNWAKRYKSYLLVVQYCNKNNPLEQREAAKKLSIKIKDKFKFDLAMYVAHAQYTSANATSKYENPTLLGDTVLRLIKILVNKKGTSGYINIADLFIKQTKNQTLLQFKESIQKYLLFSSLDIPDFVKSVAHQLTENISSWNQENNDDIITEELFVTICNRVIDFLTTRNPQKPSPLFISLVSAGHSLTLIILILKISLISKNSRTHLEIRIFQLISYYVNNPGEESKWLINFLEIFQITFAIYAEDVEYNLINMKDSTKTFDTQSNIDDYRIFSQLKLELNEEI